MKKIEEIEEIDLKGIGTTSPETKLHVEGGADIAVYGKSDSNYAVAGESINNLGVYGFSNNSEGVAGYSINGPGVYGVTDSNMNPGVLGVGNIGVHGLCIGNGYSIYGDSGDGIAIYGSSVHNYSGYFEGGKGVKIEGDLDMSNNNINSVNTINTNSISGHSVEGNLNVNGDLKVDNTNWEMYYDTGNSRLVIRVK